MTHQINMNYVSPSGTVQSALSATGDANIELNLTIAASASNAETDISITSANLQCIFLLASAAMTVNFYTGTGGTGGQTEKASFTLLANVPQFWFTGNGTNPFSGNTSQMLVTSTAGGSLQVRALLQD